VFAKVVESTSCPFAPGVRWREVRCETQGLDWRTAARRTAAEVRETLPALEAEGLDMVAVELPDERRIGSLESFVETVREFILGLPPDPGVIASDAKMLAWDWVLYVNRVHVFALTFAPFYPRLHPRHSPTGEGYIVFQFTTAFDRYRMDRMTVAGHRRISSFVRRVFEDAQRPYFAHITQGSPPSLRVVKPIDEADPPLAWWKPGASSGVRPAEGAAVGAVRTP